MSHNCHITLLALGGNAVLRFILMSAIVHFQTKPRVLIIEDEKDAYILLAYHLEREGFETIWADNGAKGLELFREHMPDAAILDVMLPRLSGYEVCRTIKADPRLRAIPVLLLTARGEVSDKLFGFECGANDYMTKPFHPKDIVSRMKRLLMSQGDLAVV